MTSKPPLSFDELLQSSSLPSPGPEHYEARRRLWLTPRATLLPLPSQPSTSRQRLEDLFNQPGVVRSQEIWSNNIEKVWRGLSSGGRLKYNLPMAIIIKIIHAAWLRDRTWPAGMEAPESEDEHQVLGSVSPARRDISQPLRHPPSTTYGRSDVMEPVPPWTSIHRS